MTNQKCDGKVFSSTGRLLTLAERTNVLVGSPPSNSVGMLKAAFGFVFSRFLVEKCKNHQKQSVFSRILTAWLLFASPFYTEMSILRDTRRIMILENTIVSESK